MSLSNLKHTVFAKTILQKREFFFSFLFSFEMVRRDDGLIEVCVHPKITIKLCWFDLPQMNSQWELSVSWGAASIAALCASTVDPTKKAWQRKAVGSACTSMTALGLLMATRARSLTAPLFSSCRVDFWFQFISVWPGRPAACCRHQKVPAPEGIPRTAKGMLDSSANRWKC